MKYSELGESDVFRFPSEGREGFSYIKIDDTTFVNIDDKQVISMEDEVFDDIFCNVEVEPWEPSMAMLDQAIEEEETVVEGFAPYYNEDDDEEDEITLVENDYFPDYELIVTIGDRTIEAFTVHCWNTSADPDEHKVTLWFDGNHVMDTTRAAVEDLMNCRPDTLREMFGDF